MYPRADQTFIIKGQGFGSKPTDQDSDTWTFGTRPSNGFGAQSPFHHVKSVDGRYVGHVGYSAAYLLIADETANWVAGRQLPGYDEQSILMRLCRWTDTEIQVTGFTGAIEIGNRLKDSKTEIEGSLIRYTRTLEVKELTVPINRVEDLRQFYRTVAKDERSTVVLKRVDR